MNHTTLQIFKMVAQEQSITLAAKKLGRAQSNITTRIQQLEEELGVELFVRGNKKMVLSAAGNCFLDYARRILSLADEAKQALHPATPVGSLRLGSMEAAAISRLMPRLPAFRTACPQVELTLQVMPTQPLIEQVLNATLDCALVSLPLSADDDPACPAEIEFAELYVEQLMLVTPEKAGRIRLAAFPRGCSYRAIAEAHFAAVGNVDIQDVGSYQAMIACVASGGYAGILPQSVIERMALPQGSQLQAIQPARTQLIWRRGYGSPALAELRHIMALATDG